jgi:hypothetical protein
MTLYRCGLRGYVVALALTILMCFSFAACVSVEKSGEQESPPQTSVMTSVMFRAEQRNAEVWVDGEFRGTAPVTLHLAAGTHQVELRLDGYETWKRELVVVAGNDTRVEATLKPDPDYS